MPRTTFRRQLHPLGLLVLLSAAAVAAQTPPPAELYYRAALGPHLLSLAPPARQVEGRLYLPLSFVEGSLGVSVTGESDRWELSFFGRTASFRLTPDPGCAGTAALVIEGEVYFAAEQVSLLLGRPLGLRQTGGEAPVVSVPTTGARLRSARLGEHPDKVRLVLDLDGETVFTWRQVPGTVEVLLPPPAEGTGTATSLGLQQFDNPRVTQVATSRSEDGFTRVEVTVLGEEAAEVFTLADPTRIVLDFPLPPPPPTEVTPTQPTPRVPIPVGQGPRWTRRAFCTARGPLDVYLLKLAPTDPKWRLLPQLASATVHSRLSVATFSRQVGAVAGINGGFFANQGPPVGLLVRDGEWISTPLFQRTILAWNQAGQFRMGRWQFDGRLVLPGKGYLALTGVNRGHEGGDELVLFTRRWGAQVEGNPLYTRLLVSPEGRVTLLETAGRAVDLPQRGWLLSGRGRFAELLKQVPVGQEARLELGLDPPWPEMWCALEAGPRLLVDGKVFIYSHQESFRSDVAASCASRSAVGLLKDGTLLLVAVESPGSDRGGVSLGELAGIMRKLGAWQAMNLDGGSSTTVVQDGKTINRVAGGSRAVSNALLVVPRSLVTTAPPPPTVPATPPPATPPGLAPAPEAPPETTPPTIPGPGLEDEQPPPPPPAENGN